MLIHRLLAAFILIPFVIIVLFFLPLNYFVTIIILICGIAVFEWMQFVNIRQKSKKIICSLIAMVSLVMMYYGLPASQFTVMTQCSLWLALAWWLLAFLLVISYPKHSALWQSNKLIKTLCGFCIIFPFFTAMIALRSINYAMEPDDGAFLLLYILVLIWVTDSGAYFAGHLFGRHKLAPNISPGKTIEGLMGGVSFAMIIAFFVNVFSPFAFSLFSIIFISFFSILVSVLGDLTESMFKRMSSMKDSGQLIPGHGGILDRIDSLTAAIPIFAVLLFVI